MKLKLNFVSSFLARAFSTLMLMCVLVPASLAEGISIKNYGHSSLLLKGDGRRILLNPFKAVGCAEGLVEPKLKVDLILASSELADEGARVSEGIFFVEPGSYNVNGFTFEGFQHPHDRVGGRRYGFATVWTWEQGGLKFAHLGGSVASLSFENKLLLGKPDVLIIAVGGGAKTYNPQEASLIVQELKPKIVIPVQYVRDSNTPNNCDQKGVEPFLEVMNQLDVKKVGNEFRLSSDLPKNMTIYLMDK